jgi:DNA-binding NarL/FixJ family response regulator
MANGGQEALTPREPEVLALLLKRWTTAEIAAHLGIEDRTVESHVSHVLDKLGVRTRQELWKILGA